MIPDARTPAESDVLPTDLAILRRRAVPRFDPDRPLDEPLLDRILRLATMAPSSFNLQPWRFLVVREARNRERLKACAFRQPKVAQAPAVVIVLGYLHPHRSHLDAMLDEQERRGLLGPEKRAEMRSRAIASLDRRTDPALWATRSAMLAAATMMMAAESLGVGSAPMEGFDHSAVRAAFGIPDDHTICCLVALGYPAEERPFPGRFGLDEVCYREHFGQPWAVTGDGGGPSGPRG
jgi:nitroreductase